MSSFDACETVSTRRARRAAIVIIVARVDERRAVGQVLRKPQMNAVVDRHDVAGTVVSGETT